MSSIAPIERTSLFRRVPHIDLRQLRYFIAVAETGSLRRGAQRLSISQPPLGRQIQQLESELGVCLLERTSRGITVTEAGQVLLEYCRELMGQLQFGLEEVEAVARGQRGRVVIEYTDDFFFSPLSPTIAQYCRDQPGVAVSFQLAYGARIVENLLSGRTDVGFLVAPVPATAEMLETQLFRPTPLVAALPSKHRLAGRSVLALRELEGESFICAEIQPTAGFYLQMASLFRRAQVTPRLLQAIWPASMMLDWVAQGLGVSLICREAAAARNVPDVCLVAISDKDATIRRCMAWRRGINRSAVENFLDQIRRSLARDLEPFEAT